MKKIYSTIAIVLVTASRLFAQCTPDPDLNHTGFSPALLPYATPEVAYSQTLSFKVPVDSMINYNGNTFHATIDSVALFDLKGIPANFNYQCLNRCVVPGGQKGCALLSGQADSSQVGSYKITTYVQTYFKIGTTPFSRIDSSSDYTFKIQFSTTGMFELVRGAVPTQIKVYPNPSSSFINLNLADLRHFNEGVIRVYDMVGKEMYRQPVYNNTFEGLDVSGYKQGLYVIQLEREGQVSFATFTRE